MALQLIANAISKSLIQIDNTLHMALILIAITYHAFSLITIVLHMACVSNHEYYITSITACDADYDNYITYKLPY